MPKSVRINHVAMGVPVGTLSESYRATLLEFYGDLLGWREVRQLRLPDRLTVFVGDSCYINLRELPESTTSERYEHFGVVVGSSEELDRIWEQLCGHKLIDVPITAVAGGGRSLRFQHLLPFAVEVQWFPDAQEEVSNATKMVL